MVRYILLKSIPVQPRDDSEGEVPTFEKLKFALEERVRLAQTPREREAAEAELKEFVRGKRGRV